MVVAQRNMKRADMVKLKKPTNHKQQRYSRLDQYARFLAKFAQGVPPVPPEVIEAVRIHINCHTQNKSDVEVCDTMVRDVLIMLGLQHMKEYRTRITMQLKGHIIPELSFDQIMIYLIRFSIYDKPFVLLQSNDERRNAPNFSYQTREFSYQNHYMWPDQGWDLIAEAFPGLKTERTVKRQDMIREMMCRILEHRRKPNDPFRWFYRGSV